MSKDNNNVSVDIADLGLRCGLEIHQQLEGRKLFCATKTTIVDEGFEFVIHRKMNATAGETGEVDIAAKKESAKNKSFAYHGVHEFVGLIGLDEQPPLPINEEAMYTTLQVAYLANAVIVPEVHIMRKTVVDGSNTSGFQRTCMVAHDGELQVDGKTITLPSICLEEDSAKIIERTPAVDKYNLTRLGIPLIEISTGPDITTAQMVPKVAKTIGMLLRSTGRVKRGLGTIRQDVNVSIKQGNRVEIKGAQDLDTMQILVEYEALRQHNIVQNKDTFAKMSVVEDSITDVTDVFSKSQKGFIPKALQGGAKAYGVCIRAGQSIIGTELQPGRRIGSDLSDYAKVHAGTGGLIHSDEDSAKYGLSDEDFATVKEKLSAQNQDAFLVVLTSEEVAKKAFSSIQERLLQLASGVPKEVRKALADGTTSYMRPMPGAARMYPETDLWPHYPETKVDIPERLDERQERYVREFSISSDLAAAITGGDFLLFEDMVTQFGSVKPSTIGEILTSTSTVLKRKHNIVYDFDREALIEVLTALDKGSIASGKIVEIIVHQNKEQCTLDEAIAAFGLLSEQKTNEIVQTVIDELGKDAHRGKIMGEIMKRSAGKADGKLVNTILNKLL